MNAPRFAILALLLGLASSVEVTREDLLRVCSEIFTFDHVDSRSIIGDIIKGLIEKMEGDKLERIDRVNITDGNSLEDIVVESKVAKVMLEMKDNLREINIKNLTVPVTLLSMTGLFNLDSLEVPGGPEIYGKGNFTIRFEDLRLFLSMAVKYKIATGLWTVSDIAVSTSASKSLIRFENLMNGEPMGDFLNFMMDEMAKLLIDVVGELVQQYKSEIMNLISQLLNGIMGNDQ